MTPNELLEVSLRKFLVEMWKTNAEDVGLEVEFEQDGTRVTARIFTEFDVSATSKGTDGA